ncbi:hypothetical protein [Magnetofaba australis]|uniref:hypothetical protein n=1 Tax=Magnetofaba australis TaxID=1472297 RepID=UPI001180EC99|nr:hypothetical protein [Magnetofaba australis]
MQRAMGMALALGVLLGGCASDGQPPTGAADSSAAQASKPHSDDELDRLMEEPQSKSTKLGNRSGKCE